jgi:hypothetical protein
VWLQQLLCTAAATLLQLTEFLTAEPAVASHAVQMVPYAAVLIQAFTLRSLLHHEPFQLQPFCTSNAQFGPICLQVCTAAYASF